MVAVVSIARCHPGAPDFGVIGLQLMPDFAETVCETMVTIVR